MSAGFDRKDAVSTTSLSGAGISETSDDESMWFDRRGQLFYKYERGNNWPKYIPMSLFWLAIV